MLYTATTSDEYLAQLYYAEQALTTEYQYLKNKAQSPFLLGETQSVAAGNLSRIGAMLTQLRLRKDAEVARYNTLGPPSSALVANAIEATRNLAEELQRAATTVAVVEAVTKFLTTLAKLDRFPGAST